MPSSYSKRVNAKGRNSKGKFIMLRYDIYDSSAWRDLSCVERCTWLEVMRRFNGNNNGNISLSCREVAGALKVSKDTASKALNRLIKVGFLRVTREAYFNIDARESRRWRLTHEGCVSPYGDRVPTNEWKKAE